MSLWSDLLQPASFRGVPFAVLTGDLEGGRRNAVHQYPRRDVPWIEDLGRGTRKIVIVGFLVAFDLITGGGEVISQREQLLGALEAGGPGTLIHPTLGQLNVSVDRYNARERWDTGQYFEVSVSFIESGERLFPSAGSDTGVLGLLSALSSDVAAAADFVHRVTAPLLQGQAVIDGAIGMAAQWGALANGLIFDATALYNSVGTLPGNFGRYFGGRTRGYSGVVPAAAAPTTVDGLIADGAQARAAAQGALETLNAAAAGSDPAALATAAQGLAAALLAATVDPADGVRLLSALAEIEPPIPFDPSQIGVSVAAMQFGCASLFRRAALAALVRAATSYQPASSDDAAALRDTIADALDAEILVAGDSADDQSFMALRQMRTAAIRDLNARGASLPPMTNFVFSAMLPALALANRIYRDAGRSDELVSEANPPHPAFMPSQFRALAA
ncbi:MAG TPA: DNA circularization N-terminal domain-containing protein [Rhizomicrobium sp.]|jgi:prophage DNA circulation protein|nr:DNA circularization N-terminal domain-containing protein [Rhizomicrobium sp.]